MENMEFKPMGLFPENSRVVFLGDSVTSSGLWLELIFEHYLKVCPERRVKVFNAAIGGATVVNCYDIRHEDFYSFDPTDAVLIYGINDINGYSGSREEKGEKFYNNIKKMCVDLISNGVRVHFCSEFHPKRSNYHEEALDIAREVFIRLANEYDTDLLDLAEALRPYQQMKNLYTSDNVHPSREGEMVIAKVFLKCQGFEGFDSDEEILAPVPISSESDRRWVLDNKLRRVRFAELVIHPKGETDEEKLMDITDRIFNLPDGMKMNDLNYYRALDYIEIMPHYDEYRTELEKYTDMMLEEALEAKKKSAEK